MADHVHRNAHGEEQPWQAFFGIEPHKAALHQPLGSWRKLRLARLRTAASGLQLKSLGHARKR